MAAHPVIPDESFPARLAVMCAPVHKLALGLAVGFIAGAFVFLLTIFQIVVQPPDAPNLLLLREYFYGYEMSVKGALIGAFWAAFVGFVAGWFLAFVRNLCVAVRLHFSRARADLADANDFLDHI